jgi:hypothetical protein
MSSGITTDPTHEKLGHGTDEEPVEQNEVYLVLSDEERAKGFVRPYRDAYIHNGNPATTYTELEKPEKSMVDSDPYVAIFDIKDAKGNHVGGRYVTQSEFQRYKKTGFLGGCGGETKMNRAISETYATNPSFYGSTYCVHCKMHLPVAEFTWTEDGKVVGS